MKLFAKKSAPKSIAEFKASAAHIQQDDAINAITGGTLSGCHTGGGGMKLASIGSLAQISSLNVSAFRTVGF
ncbi:MAG: hypothetical protein IPM37_08130 [Hahellaceae bacterium]|nr:hypothetical protein [Hahellaceae bacterium]